MQQMEIRLVILFLSRKKFHAERFFVIRNSMKLGPGGKARLNYSNASHGNFLHGSRRMRPMEARLEASYLTTNNEDEDWYR